MAHLMFFGITAKIKTFNGWRRSLEKTGISRSGSLLKLLKREERQFAQFELPELQMLIAPKYEEEIRSAVNSMRQYYKDKEADRLGL